MPFRNNEPGAAGDAARAAELKEREADLERARAEKKARDAAKPTNQFRQAADDETRAAMTARAAAAEKANLDRISELTEREAAEAARRPQPRTPAVFQQPGLPVKIIPQ